MVNAFSENLYKHDQLAQEFNQHAEQVQFNALRRLIQAFVREKVLSSIHQGNKLIFLLPHSAQTLYVDNIRFGSLARFSTFGNIYIHDKNGCSRQILNPLELLEIFISELKLVSDRKHWKKLRREVRDHLRNALLSSHKSFHLNEKIMTESKENGYADLLQWLANRENSRGKNIFFEQ